jgi:hypothetical protein
MDVIYLHVAEKAAQFRRTVNRLYGRDQMSFERAYESTLRVMTNSDELFPKKTHKKGSVRNGGFKSWAQLGCLCRLLKIQGHLCQAVVFSTHGCAVSDVVIGPFLCEV